MNRCVIAVSAAGLAAAAGMARAQAFFEGFEGGAIPAGWAIHNQSTPGPGPTTWAAVTTVGGVILARTGNDFANCNFNSGAGLSTISNWLIMPQVLLHNGDTLSFWTRTTDGAFPDRLQLRMSTAGASTNTGSGALGVGDFFALLVDINPAYSPTGYPLDYQRFTGTVSGLSAPTPGRMAFRYFVENSGPEGTNGDSIGVDDVEFNSAGVLSGACCLPDGTCTVLTQIACTGQNGVYRGDNMTCPQVVCPPPTTGACCRPDGTCAVITALQCAGQYGVYRGTNTSCSAIECPRPYVESGDAGDLPVTAAVANGGIGPLPGIMGSLGPNDADMFRILICDATNFLATTVGGSTVDTQLFLFRPDGIGVTSDDDDPTGGGAVFQSTLTSRFVAPLGSGIYLLAISEYDQDPLSAGGEIWNDVGPFGTFAEEHAPDGPGAGGAISSWDTAGGAGGAYFIRLVGACYFQSEPTCYANCDASTSPPFLNVNDFVCFQSRFAAGQTYANCDGSTLAPVLNVNDFVCFQNKFAAGCSAP